MIARIFLSIAVVITFICTAPFKVSAFWEYQQSGNHILKWDASGMPSGLYFYTLKANGIIETRKIVLVK